MRIMSLKGKVALVTGAGKGIGKSIAQLFAQEKAIVVCNSLSDSSLLTTKEIIDSNGKAMSLQFDITNKLQVNSAVESIIKKYGKIDVLVNNAGRSAGMDLVHEMKEEVWDRTIAVCLKGCFLCSQAVIPSMIEHNYGKIINIASVRAETGLERDSAYSAAKSGIYGFTRSLAKEVAKYHINVNAISPGIIRVSDSAVLPWEEYEKIVPLGIGKPLDIANGALYLSTDKSSYMTGQVLHINGGWWPTMK